MNATNKHTLLLIDDKPANLIALKSMLEKPNREIITCNSGNEGLQILLKEKVSLILVDVQMPEMDGYMLARKIKADVRFSGVPVIMHTSLSGHWNHQLGSTVGADGYVSKFEPARLAEALTRTLSARAT